MLYEIRWWILALPAPCFCHQECIYTKNTFGIKPMRRKIGPVKQGDMPDYGKKEG
jgi:hypothetical protein